MSRSLASALLSLALALVACGGPPSAVAPLRYETGPTVAPREEPFRAVPPGPLGDAPIPRFAPQSDTLPNGLRVIVVPRSGHGTIAAQLVLAQDLVDLGDNGGAHLRLLAPVFFAPVEENILAAAQCGDGGCTIAAQALDGELDVLVDRLASLALHANEEPTIYARRLATMSASAINDPNVSMARNMRRLLFDGPPYGLVDPGAPVPLSELQAIRDAILKPSTATIVVVGDVTLEAARAAVATRFGTWASPPASGRASGARGNVRPSRPRERVVVVQNDALTQIHAAVVARGPAASDPDQYPLSIAMNLLGATRDSDAFTHVREELGAAYSVGASLQTMTRDVSFLSAGGSFEREKATAGLSALLAGVRALRDAPVSAERLAYAKAATLGGWRARISTNAGVAASLAARATFGLDPDVAALASKVEAVTADDVQRAARKWLAEDVLRVVLVGPMAGLKHGLPSLGLGDYVERDGFARDR